MPCKILQVDDVGIAFAGRRDCRHAKRMHIDVGIEAKPVDISFDQLLHGPPRNWLPCESSPSTATSGDDSSEEWASKVVADTCGVEPGFKPFLRLLVQWHQPFVSALAEDFKNLMHAFCL